MNEFSIQENKFTIRETGIEFREPLSFEEWKHLGHKLSKVGKSIGFLIGDWINYGEKAYGEMYLEVLKETGFDYSTLRVFAHVARRIELLCRHNNLGFEHHKIVAKLPPEEQRKWLDTAEKESLSKRRLRKSLIAGRVISIEEMRDDPADQAQITYMVWINRLCYWWKKRIDEDPIEKWDEQDRINLKRDLRPIVRIFESL